MVDRRVFRLGEFYRIVWDDIVSFSGWESKPKEKPHECVSMGWLTEIGRSSVTLSATRSQIGDDVQYNQHIVIPKKVIRIAEAQTLPSSSNNLA